MMARDDGHCHSYGWVSDESVKRIQICHSWHEYARLQWTTTRKRIVQPRFFLANLAHLASQCRRVQKRVREIAYLQVQVRDASAGLSAYAVDVVCDTGHIRDLPPPQTSSASYALVSIHVVRLHLDPSSLDLQLDRDVLLYV